MIAAPFSVDNAGRYSDRFSPGTTETGARAHGLAMLPEPCHGGGVTPKIHLTKYLYRGIESRSCM